MSLLLRQDPFRFFFDQFPSNDTADVSYDWTPAVRIDEQAEQYVLNADVPGVDPAAIEITLEDGVLTLAGTREGFGSFKRRFSLPESVDAESVKASGKHGVLTVVIPKRASAKPRKITVNA